MDGVAARILVVCTGNLCRSPIAEEVLRLRVASFATVSSAGTRAVAGAPMEPHAATVLVEHGLLPDPGFRARQVTAPMLASADLVLTATRQQRAEAISWHPLAARKTYTLREFARLVTEPELPAFGSRGAARVRDLVDLAMSRRGLVRAPHPAADDIADPYLRDLDAFRRAGREIVEAIELITGALAPLETTACD